MVKKRSSRRSSNPQSWFLLGLLGALLAAPNATVLRYSLGHIDPFLFNVLRFAIIAVVTLPFLVMHFGRLRAKNLRLALLAGFYMAIAVVAFVLAIKHSQASYVSTITLFTPIVFVLYSVRMTGEKISTRAMAGITLAAVGAMVIVALPVAIHQGGNFVFYPVATVWALINCLTFPLAVIYMKRANEAGLNMSSMMSISSWVVVALNALCFAVFGNGETAINQQAVFGILYSGVVVALIARIISVVTYEHIGSAVTGALAYLETFLAIMIPIFVLGERLSVEMVTGGILILLGVYVVEHHKSKAHKHYHIHRLH